MLIKKSILKFNNLMLLAALIAFITPMLYSSLNVFWTISINQTSYSVANSMTYVQMLFGIIEIWIFLPLFRHTQKNENATLTFFIFTIIIGLLMYIIVGLFSPMIVNNMVPLNPNVGKQTLYSYLIITISSQAILMIPYFIIIYMLTKNEWLYVIIFTIFRVILMALMDLLFFSPFSPFSPSVINVAWSTFTSTLIITVILFIYFLIRENVNLNKIKGIRISYLKPLIKDGFWVGMGTLIRNVLYMLVTLKIITSLGSNSWNAWNLSNYIYWSYFLIFGEAIAYASINSYGKCENNEDKKLVLISSLIYIGVMAIIWIITAPIMITYLLPAVSNNASYLETAQKTAYILLPFMLMFEISRVLETRFVAESKTFYLFLNTFIVNLLINVPLWIMISFNVHIPYFANTLIYCLIMVLTITITSFQYYYLNRVNVENDKYWIFKKIKK